MSGELGKASLDLEANLQPFETNVRRAKGVGNDLQHSLDALASVATLAERALNDVKMSPRQAAESKASAEGILQGVRGVSDEARAAAREMDRVRLTEAQAAETDVAGDQIDRKLKSINRNANETRRALDRVRLRIGSMGGASSRPGVGVGPFGSGYGRIGLLGTAVGLGALTGPAAAPGAAGLLASIPTLGAGGIGALGTLALALHGVGKAIGGDKKAFDDLQPSAKQFVLTVRSLDGLFEKLRQTAGGALFPGLTTGLKAALSPELIGTVTRAISQLGGALGRAGAQWGRYFGSPQFTRLLGPLMTAGAHNIRTLSDTFLHLFDALVTLAKAAIPFTDWLVRAADKGAKLVDTWTRAGDASGALGRALGEAKTSLQLVWGLFKSLLSVVGALGAALYPVAKVAVKDLTDGLNALAGIIDRNKQTIREIVGGALAALVSTVKTLTPIVKVLAHALEAVAHAVGGWKSAFEIVIGGFLASKFVTLAGKIGGVWSKLGSIGPRLAGIGGESEAATAEVGGLRLALLGLGAPEVLGALALLIASLKIISELRTHAHDIKDEGPVKSSTSPAPEGRVVTIKGRKGYFIETPGFRGGPVFTPISNAEAHQMGVGTGDSQRGDMRGAPANHGYPSGREPGTATPYLDYLLSKAAGTSTLKDDRSVLTRMIAVLSSRLRQAHTLSTKTALQDAVNADKAQLQAAQSSPYGADPAFTKNLGATGGKAAVIPPAAAHDLSLASANASRASVLGNTGAVAKKYLEAELVDLHMADKLIKAKYESATGKARTSLFAALTSVENKMRTVRERLGKSIKDGRAAELKFAVDQAKEAVAAATVGSAAWKKAVAAEAKALRAEIAYWDRRAHNKKLSVKARDAALRAELSDQRALKALLKPSSVAAGANESQFLSSFADIVKSFAPNAFPVAVSGGKTDTHLHDLKNEARQTNKHLKDIATRTRFPSSAYTSAAAEAVAG
jgi:hypothetical protein